MTKTIRTIRTTAETMLTEIGTAVGVFVGLAWLAANVATVAGTVGDWSVLAVGVPEVGRWLGVLAVASLGTIWLERDGYRSVRADPTSGGEFAWLSVCYLPVGFLPTAYAVGQFVSIPAAANLYLIACTVGGGWLAFYGGLDRLGVDSDRFGWTSLVVFAVVLVAVAIDSTIGPPATLETIEPLGADVAVASLAFVCQSLALVVGFGGAVRSPDASASRETDSEPAE
ncbi:hypothetical protein [Natrarchaeobius oligotrophus]|uniref:Uncharacterized protein n=1 Tax=Natrarchaeobius chitinivorans TaxID=1679083 RepID=A0A3N6PHC4_NATCH|nr:hypothetical protein [Natrarchaeobius chitinivorans]RQG97405.1 hypothetical protein EA472_19440 [Natrarchaeobius chitinivorans]